MFGIGFGEILLILLVVFLISPKELPAVFKKIGQFFKDLERLKRELFSVKGEIDEIIDEARRTIRDTGEHPPIKIGDVEMIYKKENRKNKFEKEKEKIEEK